MAGRILTVCCDSFRVGTDRLVDVEGQVVVPVSNIAEAQAAYGNGSFDLVIIGQSLSERDITELVGFLRSAGGGAAVAVLRHEHQ